MVEEPEGICSEIIYIVWNIKGICLTNLQKMIGELFLLFSLSFSKEMSYSSRINAR